MEPSTTQPITQPLWRRPITWIIVGALLLRLMSIAVDTNRINWQNERLFTVPAAHLVEGHGLTQANGLPTAYRPPLYILWLAGAYTLFEPYAEIGPAILQALLGTLNVLLVFLIGKRIWKRTDTASLGAALLAIHPYAVWHDVAVSYTVLATTTSLLFLWTFLRAQEHPTPKRIMATGMAAGLIPLLTTTAIPVLGGIFIATVMFWKIPIIKRATMLTIALSGCILVWGPWIIRNAIVFHAVVPTTTETGLTLWYGNNPESPWRLPTHTHEDTPVPPGTPIAHDNINGCINNAACVQVTNELTENHAFTALAISWITTHPTTFVRLSAWRLAHIWSPFLVPAKTIFPHATLNALITWGYAAWTTCLYVFGVIGAWQLWNARQRWNTLLLCAWILIPPSLYAIALHFTRYRIPFEAALLPLTAAGILHLYRKKKRQTLRKG